ncbi:MAG: hypothetical protein M1473_02760 [Firmicutes bacterium]|nr:hypothetical protein [Gammaproteobacteria bacterium]MCL5049447.1 hypothetical protein [Bacillota bacterium]
MRYFRLLTAVLLACTLSGCIIYYNSGGFNSGRYYIVSTVVGGQGQISPRTAQVLDGERLTITLSPASGWTVGTASGCNGQLQQDTYVTGRIRADCSVRIEFVEIVGEQVNTFTTTSWTNSAGYTLTVIEPGG